jgi:hypothetical protein
MSTSLPDSREMEIKKDSKTITRPEKRPKPTERASSQECTASRYDTSKYVSSSIDIFGSGSGLRSERPKIQAHLMNSAIPCHA